MCLQRGRTALLAAAANGHLGAVEALLGAGANKEAKSEVGYGGWSEACTSGSDRMGC